MSQAAAWARIQSATWATSPAVSAWAFCAATGLLWLGTVPLTSGLLSGVFGFAFFGHPLARPAACSRHGWRPRT